MLSISTIPQSAHKPTNILQDDLKNLNIASGQCVNTTVRQDVTFGLQGLPFGINLGKGKKSAATTTSVLTAWPLALALGAALFGIGLRI